MLPSEDGLSREGGRYVTIRSKVLCELLGYICLFAIFGLLTQGGSKIDFFVFSYLMGVRSNPHTLKALMMMVMLALVYQLSTSFKHR
jgi:hypothetical protein